MPKKRLAAKSRQRNVGIARASFQQADNENMDTMEYPSLTYSVTLPSVVDSCPPPGYDKNSSTREIFANLEKQVEQEQAEGNEVNKDVNTKGKERRSNKRRYSGNLKAYDNMSSEDIVKKFENLSRRGSTMYSKEVGRTFLW